MEKKNNNGLIIGILIGFFVLLLLGSVLFTAKVISLPFKLYNDNKDKATEIIDQAKDMIDKAEEQIQEQVETNSNNNTEITTNKETNMTNEETIDFWKKIKGNWAKVEYNDNYCAGFAIEINTNVTIKKFNSDGITVWNILSFEKINKNNYKINLVSPANLNDAMNGGPKASYTAINIDVSNINNKKINVTYYGGITTEFEYVGENKTEVSNFQFIDTGFSQDYYCKWYKEK